MKPAVVNTEAVVLWVAGVVVIVLDEWAAAGTWLVASLLTVVVADAGLLVVGSAVAGPGAEVSEAEGVVVAMLAVLNDAGALVVVTVDGVLLV